ncbi:MAG: hypothetical protein GY806_12645 [Gammaproteobacteria bacterium]|nr:hypothetical protein [Gammaproteobacteria bacterium]
MLREIKEASQKKGEPKRRWFTSLSMDLFVWLNDEDEIISYQLTYNKPHKEKALTWSKEKGFAHLGVDDGTRSGKHPGSPLLVKDGVIKPDKIISMLRKDSGELKSWIKNFIVSGIEEHLEYRS